jgi:L-rhamnose mutarotase
MKRMGMVIGIKPERIAEYKKTHAAVWPEVLAKISDCNMRNYTIFLREPENLLFGYFEYHGADWAADSAKMAADPKTQEWWAIHNPMQTPLPPATKAIGGPWRRRCFTPTEPGPWRLWCLRYPPNDPCSGGRNQPRVRIAHSAADPGSMR